MDFTSHFNVEFTFQRRPQYYSPDLNVERGLAILVLILKICCRRNSSSFQRLQVLNWAVKNEDSRSKFLNFLNNPNIFNIVIIRHEPWLNRAIEIALGEKIIESPEGKKISLTKYGDSLADEILSSKSFINETDFLYKVKKEASEKKLEDLIKLVSDS